MQRSGVSVFWCVLVLLSACIPYGFAGGGLPSNIKTVAVLPFDNETSASTLQGELFDEMKRGIEGRLGLRAAAEARADAIVRGRIVRYDPDVPIAYSADPNSVAAARRQLRIAIDVEIVDQTNGKTLWARKGLSADGEYAETAEAEGRRNAIRKLVQDVVAGAQSQW